MIKKTLTAMLYRVFDLSYSKLKSSIDDESLQRLLHKHEVVSRQKRFYVHDGLPHLVVSVLYRLATLTGSQAPGRREDRPTPSQVPDGVGERVGGFRTSWSDEEKFFRSAGGDLSVAFTTLGPCSQSSKQGFPGPGPKTCAGVHQRAPVRSPQALPKSGHKKNEPRRVSARVRSRILVGSPIELSERAGLSCKFSVNSGVLVGLKHFYTLWYVTHRALWL